MACEKLTPKQKLFVKEYLLDLNATAAALRAGYAKRKNIAQIACRLLKRKPVAEAVEKDLAARAARVEINQDSVVRELAKIAFGDLRQAAAWGPDGLVLKPSDQLTEEQAACIREVSERRTKDGGEVKIKRHDKVKALELLGRHLGLFVDRVDHRVSAVAEVIRYHMPLNGRDAPPQSGINASRSQSIGRCADLCAAGATAANCRSRPGGGRNGHLTEALPEQACDD